MKVVRVHNLVYYYSVNEGAESKAWNDKAAHESLSAGKMAPSGLQRSRIQAAFSNTKSASKQYKEYDWVHPQGHNKVTDAGDNASNQHDCFWPKSARKLHSSRKHKCGHQHDDWKHQVKLGWGGIDSIVSKVADDVWQHIAPSVLTAHDWVNQPRTDQSKDWLWRKLVKTWLLLFWLGQTSV